MSNLKVILVTGANTGLGLEIVRALCRSSTAYTLIIGSRTVSNGDEAVAALSKEYPSTSSVLDVVEVELGSDSSLKQAVDTIAAKYGKLDILLNNAGAGFDRRIQSGELGLREGFNKTWDTNVTGTYVLTTFAIPLLLKSSDPRLIFVTSGTSSLIGTEDMSNPAVRHINSSPPQGWPKEPVNNPVTIYRSTKTGLNMVMREFHRILKNDGVKVWGVSPGFLATNLGGFTVEQLKNMGAIDPSVGADFTIEVIEGKLDQYVGKVVRKAGVQPW